MSMEIPTSSTRVTNQVNYYAESDGYGVPVEDPTLLNAGIISDVDISVTIDHEVVNIQGSRKQYADIQMGMEAVITLDYRFLNTKLLNYGIQDPNGTGTIEESLAFIFSRKIDDTEMFCVASGCTTEQATVNFDRVPTCSQQFYSSNVSEWLTLAELKTLLTVVTDVSFAAALTAEPWTHLTGSDGSSSSVTVDSGSTDITKMTITVNNNLLKQKPLGYLNVRFVEAGNKVVTVSVEPYLYSNKFFLLVRNYTSFSIVGCLRLASPTVNITVTGVKLNSYTDKVSAAGGDFTTVPSAGTAIDVSCTDV